MLARWIQEAGHEILEADSPDAALDVMEKQPVAVVFSDIQMPRHDGLWLTAELQNPPKHQVAERDEHKGLALFYASVFCLSLSLRAQAPNRTFGFMHRSASTSCMLSSMFTSSSLVATATWSGTCSLSTL